MSAAWEPPREFDDYVVVRRLGTGSDGSVWLAQDTVLARHVAIKFAGAPHPDAADRQRFVNGARAAARLQHPNVVSIYGVGELGDRPYLITEFVRGRTLDELEKPLPWREAHRLALDLARGLSAAHRSGVLHCDLKPGNAIVDQDGSAKLLDFGLAAFLKAGEAAGPLPEGISGTPAYLAPEIWSAEAHTRRSDVYALGALLYELLAGRPPFAGVPLEELPRVSGERDPPPLPPAGDDAEAQLHAVVARCLRRAPGERFASGDDLREALEGVARTGASALRYQGNPYRGLRAFQADHRNLFFGRSADVGVALDRLRSDAFLLVTGDSGVGKSSLCRAGVLPAVAEGGLGDGRAWTVATAVPGRAPVEALSALLGALAGREPASLAAELRESPGALARTVQQGLGQRRGILLFVDQLEELVTLAEPAEATLVDRALAELAGGLPGVRLVATLRADFLTRLSRLPRLAEDLSRVLYFLRPLSPERMREVIVGPARATGIRFESEALVEALVAATAAAEGGLPLLQFALAELWEQRDVATGTITQAALDRAGGVSGALARHGDAVLAALPPHQRARARRMLLRLVTLEGTRARRTAEELAAQDPAASAALDALVQGRLVVAQDAETGSAYELAHEVLVQGWGTLARWLQEEAERRAQREGLSQKAAEWVRLARAPEALLGPGSLRELEALAAEDLTPLEAELLRASGRALRRRTRRFQLLVVAVPALALAVWAAAAASARSETRRKVEQQVLAGHAALAGARRSAAEAHTARDLAFARFDAGAADAEPTWAQALQAARTADRDYAAAGGALEAAVALDPGAAPLRAELADMLYERAELAETWRHTERRDELVQRFSLYDSDGSRRRRWSAPATLSVKCDPPGATIRVLSSPGAGAPPRDLGESPLAPRPIQPGSWLLEARAPGRVPARLSLLAGRGATVALEARLPEVAAVPRGFAYLPPGTFLFGSGADEQLRRGFLNAQPLHPVETRAYLAALTEITYGDWIAWLDALAPAERARRQPAVAASPSTPGALRLVQAARGWELHLQVGAAPAVAGWGEPLVQPERKPGTAVDWRRLPVTGVSAEDLEAYAAWLRRTGRVPGARLCTELEWERAARGADGRTFPGGEELAAEDANFAATQGKDGVGPDPVGSHPGSRSPYELEDASGNAFELTRAADGKGYVARGGSYWHDRTTAQLPNRELVTPTMRDPTVGGRVCASSEP